MINEFTSVKRSCSGLHLAGLFAAMGLLAACATGMGNDPTSGKPTLQVQNRLLLTPANGGQRITTAALQPGDIILSSTNRLTSMGIRLLTVSPVRPRGPVFG
jgi:hypothetical protein